MQGLLSENTRIRTPDNIDLCIECLDPGDTILSAIATKELSPNIQIKETNVVGVVKMLCDHFNIVDDELIGNDNQLVFVNGDWYPIKEIIKDMTVQKLSDKLVSSKAIKNDNQLIDAKIKGVDRFNKQVGNVMYSLILKESDCFFAEGFIVKGEQSEEYEGYVSRLQSGRATRPH